MKPFVKSSLNYLKWMIFSTIMLFPTFAFAADDLSKKADSIIQSVISLLLSVAVGLATAAFIWNGIKFFLSTDGGKRADSRESMKTTLVILIAVLLAKTIIGWIVSNIG
jgi:uncharacterized membrane protein YbjE (DUF340 family)